jgi:uncharacterized membrane protein YbhN (UPF0104 family)
MKLLGFIKTHSAKPAKLLRTLLPWAVAAAIFYYLFQKIPPREVWHSLSYVRLAPFLLFSVVYFLGILMLDTWGLTKVIGKFSHPVSFRELLPVRCVTYLLSIVNYNAGQAGIALSLKRKQGASFFKTLGSLVFVAATDLYWLIALALLGSFFFDLNYQGIVLKDWVQRIAIFAFAALFLHMAFWQRWFSRILPVKIHFAFADWIRGRHIFQTFHHAKVGDYLRIALYRLPIHLLIFSSVWILVHLFGATISWRDIMGSVPVIFLIGALPITPGGLGSVQFAMVELLQDKIASPAITQGDVRPQELLLALSLSWMAANYLLKVLAGFLYWLKEPSLLKNSNAAQLEKP